MVFKKLFGGKQEITQPPESDILLQDGDAYLAFCFADMQATYASQDAPDAEHYEIRRDKEGGWMLRREEGKRWESLANRFPAWSERVKEIDKAFEKFLMSILIDEESKVQ